MNARGPACAWEGWSETVTLDPVEPFLADHQPGGYPLLGTVASLELLSQAALRRHHDLAITALESVELPGPIHLRGGRPIPATVLASGPPDSSGRCGLSLATRETGGLRLHVICDLVLGNRFAGRAPHRAAPIEPRRTVARELIYDAFFHGPTFRVVDRAWLTTEGLTARLAAGLPSWRRDGRDPSLAPRVIEFALQSAGLLQLARFGDMKIPYTIDRIRRWSARDVDAHAPLFAMARLEALGEASVYDIDVVDGDGRGVISVERYACIPLPFATETSKLERLAQAFAESARAETRHMPERGIAC